MIVRRNRTTQPNVVRKIVRRTRPAVGNPAPGRRIIRRHNTPRAGVIPGAPPQPNGLPRQAIRRSLPVALALLLLATTLAGATWLYRSPHLRIQTIQVEGLQRIPQHTIVETSNALGQSMITADLPAIQRAISALPLVASVRVQREWPTTLRVTVQERRPWGTWEQSGVDYIIDREGVVIAIGEHLGSGAPAIRSSEAGTRLVGDRVDPQAVDAAAQIYELLPQQLGTTVAEVAFITGKGIQITTTEGTIALFGDSSSIAYKLAVWAALTAEARQRQITYTTIDLRYGNRPVLQ